MSGLISEKDFRAAFFPTKNEMVFNYLVSYILFLIFIQLLFHFLIMEGHVAELKFFVYFLIRIEINVLVYS